MFWTCVSKAIRPKCIERCVKICYLTVSGLGMQIGIIHNRFCLRTFMHFRVEGTENMNNAEKKKK